MILDLTGQEQDCLEERLAVHYRNERYQCPFLLDRGCLFPFNTRPLVCASAYPCFAGDWYHRFLASKQGEIKTLYSLLQAVTSTRIIR
jgi:hypothetical protein